MSLTCCLPRGGPAPSHAVNPLSKLFEELRNYMAVYLGRSLSCTASPYEARSVPLRVIRAPVLNLDYVVILDNTARCSATGLS